MSSSQNASQNAEQLKKQTQEQADKVSADAKQTANKVSNMINKEAEEIESHAKSAGKEISKGFHSSVDHIHDAFNKFVSNPKYWASTLSVVNAVVLGAAGYFAYLHRNQVQTWDKKLLSAIAVGVATFVGGESYLATTAAKKQSNK